MTGRTPGIVVALALAAPAVALAAGDAGARSLVIDFERAGLMKDLLAKTLGVAKSFLFFSAFVAYALEAFGRAPTSVRDYSAVTWRLVTVLFLLWNYQPIFGSVIGLMDQLEKEVAPESTWDKFKAQVTSMRESLDDLASHGEKAPDAKTPGAVTEASAVAPPAGVTAWAYEALIACLQLLGQGVVFLVRWLSRILTATLFILGPLALVASVPRMSGTGARWFHRFVTIASWPVFAGVLLSVLVTVGAQGAARHSYLECLVAALVLLVTALSTPTLASHVVGGALQNFAAVGHRSAKAAHHDLLAPVGRAALKVAGGVSAGVVTATQAVRRRFGSGGGAEGGGAGGGLVVANPPASPGPRGQRGRGAGGTSEDGPPRGASPRTGGTVVANPPALPPAPGPGPKGRGSGSGGGRGDGR